MSLVANYWWSTIIAIVAAIAVSILLTYKLGTLTPGFSARELSQSHESAHIALGQNPLFFMHSGAQHILQNLNHFGFVAMRLPSVMVAGLAVFCFYSVLAHWYTKRLALLGVLSIATSSWLLHSARLASHEAMFFLLFALFAATLWLQRNRTSSLAILSCLFLTGTLLYIPGMVWFILPLVVWQRRRIRNIVAAFVTWQQIAIILFSVLVLLPLLWAGFHNHNFLRSWLGFPAQWAPPKEIMRSVLHIPALLFWHGPSDPTLWLGRLPLLDWFQTVMFVVGLYAYRFKLGLDRTWFLAYVLIIGSILVALKGSVSIALLLPFIYLIVASGIALMLQQWFTVFPRNPFARTFGITILVLALLTSCLYQLDHYYIAWPHTPETKASFQHLP